MRQLATIQKIATITPIEGADNIVLATMENLGWQCVIKKDEFKIGDLIIYCEIDSVLPDKPEYDFLRSRNFRIRTIKLRGVLSQGLILPIESTLGSPHVYNVGDDVTDDLGIVIYLTPAEREDIAKAERQIKIEKNRLKKFMMRYSWFRKWFLSRSQRSGFPYWISKTDEQRVQSLHWTTFYNQFSDKTIYISEKVDGCSGTFTGQLIAKYPIFGKLSPKKYKFIVASRNLTTNDKTSIYWKVAEKYNLEKILKENPNLTIQGECCDTKIQGNKYGFTDVRFFVFNIINHRTGYQFDSKEMWEFCGRYNLQMVPLLELSKLSDIGATVDDFLNYASKNSTLANVPREGVVIRCIENGNKIFSFKAINNNFLLKYNE